MSISIDELTKMKSDAVLAANAAATAADLEEVRIQYLGRRGHLPKIMRGLKDADATDRPRLGQLANELKQELMAAIEARKASLAGPGVSGPAVGGLDVTLPGQWRGLGFRHPVSLIVEETARIFGTLGFTVADGPDIETEFYNFDALNTPVGHPARAEQDTFWLESGELLRTQTSPVQIKVMEKHKPPVRIIAPGRCYRRDTSDATHSASFHQVEGLYVDRDVSMADLKSDITYFAREMLGPGVRVRFRPHFFPFTEPSVEYDFSCHLCDDKGCRVCKYSGWIEIGGAGMVDPRVFEKVGYDPEEVTGYAFGWGVERIAMIKYGINDIRLFYESDVRFLNQFQ